MTKAERLANANKLIEVIATCGRRFFHHDERVAKLEMDSRGRIWFIDSYSQKRIYTHYENGRWRGFTHGGSLRSLVITLRRYIVEGRTIAHHYTFGPWPKSLAGGNLWGYGDDMQKVRDAARELGILSEIQPKAEPSMASQTASSEARLAS
ncbi:MAG: hypothetical protein AB1631_29690 [Acidobacteriota bacterium]